jgi:UDP-4-amino-4,6-dideoxy-N-acetyl-beta-L-altrosamine N-acetyltransferase
MSVIKKHFKAVGLNRLEDSVVEDIRLWRNQPFVREKMYNQDVITVEEHEKYIQSVKEDPNRDIYVFYLDQEPFGVYQYKIQPEGYLTGGNYLISQEYQDMGYGVIQAYFMNEIAFHHLHCHKTYGEMLDSNRRVIMMNEKLGVVREGVLRQHILIDGTYHDVHCYGMLAQEWEDKKRKIEKIVFQIVSPDYSILS